VRVIRLQPVEDASQDWVAFDKRLAIGEAKHVKPMRVQLCRSECIDLDRIRLEMLSAVELDEEPCFDAREVRDVLANGMLPAELVAAEPTIAHALPQCVLGIG
jgi:hypothetical protein